MIIIKDVTKKYGAFTALDNISLELPNTGLIALTGENGCGKTTLLNLISTVDKPEKGSISFNDVKYCSKNYLRLRNLAITYIQQDSIFSEWMTVSDNFSFSCASSEQSEKMLLDYNIPEKSNSFPSTLSGGQRQKCSFIRGAVKNTPVLLVDEPTNNMDAMSEEETFRILKKLSSNRLVVVVSHNHALINVFADLTVFMDKGKVVEINDNRSSGGMIIEEDEVKIPSDPRYSIVEDWKKLKSILSIDKSIKLSLYNSSLKTSTPLNYSVEPFLSKKLSKRNNDIIYKASLKSIAVHPFTLALTCLFTALILLLSSLSLCLCSIDCIALEYDIICENGYVPTAFKKDYSSITSLSETEDEVFSDYSEDYLKFCSYSGLTGILLGGIDNNPWDLGLSGTNKAGGFQLFGPAYIDCNKSNSINLASGNLPEVGEAMISDYMADQIISEGFRTSYEDIISRGIIVNHFHIAISGIIKSDYKSVPLLLEWNDNTQYTAEEFNYATYLLKNYLCRLFLNQKEYISPRNDGCSLAIINYGSIFAEIKVVEGEQFEDGVAHINENLFQKIYSKSDPKSSRIKCQFCYSQIATDAIEDGLDRPVIYVSKSLYQNNSDDILDSMQIESVLFSISNVEEYAIIRENLHMTHDIPMSIKVSDTISAINALRNGVSIILSILIVLTVGFAFWTWCDSERKVSYGLYTMIVNGYSAGQIYIFTICKLGVRLIIELITSIAIYLGSLPLLNNLIEKANGFKITLLPFNPIYAIEAFGLYFILMIIVVSLHTFKLIRTKPINLYFISQKKR